MRAVDQLDLAGLTCCGTVWKPDSVWEATESRVLADIKDGFSSRIERLIRERAIRNADTRIALNGTDRASLTEDDYEAIVAEERGKLVKKLQLGSLGAVAVILGIH